MVTISKEINHARMFEDCARVGEQPVVLCLDTNMKRSGVIEAAIQSGRYIDVAEGFAGSEGPEPTYCQNMKWAKIIRGEGNTRPDRIFVNRIAWEMVEGFRLRRDCIIPGRVPLELALEGETIGRKQLVMKVPKMMEVHKIDDLEEGKRMRIAEEVWEKGKEVFLEARKEKKVDKAWHEACKMADEYIKKCLRMLGAKVKEEIERGKGMELIEENVAAEARKGNKENPQTKKGGKNHTLEEMVRKAHIKWSIGKGLQKDNKGTAKDWTESQIQGSRLIAKADMIHLWKMIQKKALKRDRQSANCDWRSKSRRKPTFRLGA